MFPCLRQLVEAADSPNLLDLVFANFSDLAYAPADFGLIKPDAYHPPLILRTYLQHFPNSPTSTPPYRNYSAGDYVLLYSTLSGAVASPSGIVHDAMEKSIPYSYARKSKFPPWFSKALRHYIAKKDYYHRRFQKKQTSYYYDKFVFYRKLVEHSIKSDRPRWLETIDNNLRAQPQHL
jgi:hypothetical protein